MEIKNPNFVSNQESEINLDSIYKEAKKEIETHGIKLDEFSDLYGPQVIEEDQKEIERLEKEFQETSDEKSINSSKLATILEAVISKHSEASNWFGPNAFCVKTSRYDDIKNGVDMVVEFLEETSASHLALGIDVTFSPRLKKKFDRIKIEIEKGKLAKVKYFKSQNLGFRGELTNLPRFVVMIDNETAESLGRLDFLGKNEELGKHFIQLQILSQILIESKVFKKYALQVGQKSVAKSYQKIEEIIRPIYQEKIKNLYSNLEKEEKEYIIRDIEKLIDNLIDSDFIENLKGLPLTENIRNLFF